MAENIKMLDTSMEFATAVAIKTEPSLSSSNWFS